MKESLIALLQQTDRLKRLTNVSKPGTKWADMYNDLLEYTHFLPNGTSTRERLYYVRYNRTDMILCAVCAQKATWYVHGNNIYTYGKYCYKCAKKSPESKVAQARTMQEKYGVDHNWNNGELRTATLKNNILKYGTDDEIDRTNDITSISQLTHTKRKTKKTMLDRYDIHHNFCNGQMRTNSIKTTVLLYGDAAEQMNVDSITSVSQLSHIKRKIRTVLDHIDDSGTSKRQRMCVKAHKTRAKLFYDGLKTKYQPDYTFITTKQEYINTTDSVIQYKHKCGSMFVSHIQHIRCTTCYPYNKSIAEEEILTLCRSYRSDTISSDRKTIRPFELDVYIPSLRFAIEYDGLYWHSSDSKRTENKLYHITKTNMCKDIQITLLHIFENEWINPTTNKIWKSIIRNKLNKSKKIYARTCTIKIITTNEKNAFLTSNHLQGSCPSSVNIGLYSTNTLVSIMTFGKSRYTTKYKWELLRFCNVLNTTIVGGASKIFKHFLQHNKGNIVSYADLRLSNGNLYSKLKFELIHISPPNYWYWKPTSTLLLESRIKYQKHKLKNKLVIFDDQLTESENMYNNGYRKIYDCGNQVWVYNNHT